MNTKSSLWLRTLRAGIALGVCGMLHDAALAVERTFSATGADTKFWSNGANWDGGEAPQAGDDLYFSRGGSASQTTNNDLDAGVIIRNITLEGTRQMTISGNGITLSGSVANLTSNQQITLGVSVELTEGDHVFHSNSNHSRAITVGTNTTTISGAGGIVKTGTGLLQLGGTNNSFSGGVTVLEGVLRAQGSTTLFGSGTLTVGAGATVELNQSSVEVSAIAGSGTIGHFHASNSSRLTVNTTAHSTFDGTMVDGSETAKFHLIVAGSGTLTLTATNHTYTGTTYLNGGTLEVYSLKNGGEASSIGQSGTAAANLVFDSGTLRYVGTGDTTDRNFQIGTSGGTYEATIDASGSGALVFSNTSTLGFSSANNVSLKLTLTGTNTDDNQLSGVLVDRGTGKGILVKTGEGTWMLTGSHSYTGGTEIAAGTLKLASANDRLSKSGAILVSGGTLDLDGYSQTTSGSITLQAGRITNGTLVKTGGSYTVQTGTISAQLAGNAGLIKSTEGVVLLEGSHTYTGATELNEGTLIVRGQLASNVAVAAGARLDGYGTIGTLSGGGEVGGVEAPGILTAASLSGAEGLDFTFRFTQSGAPIFGQPNASGNDLLRLTAETPFAAALNADNRITLDFSGLTLNVGMELLGGFYADHADFAEAIRNADYQYLGLNGFALELSVIAYEATFSGETVQGYISRYLVIPEPATASVFGTLGALILCFRRKRHHAC